MNTVTPGQYLPEDTSDTARITRGFRAEKFDFWSFFFSGLTGLATLFIIGILATILVNIIYNGWSSLSWHFVSTIPTDLFDMKTTGILPMIVGTTIRVFIMTFFVIPVGVITAIYLTEYAPNTAIITRIIRAAVNNLAGVPSIVFGLFGLGLLHQFCRQKHGSVAAQLLLGLGPSGVDLGLANAGDHDVAGGDRGHRRILEGHSARSARSEPGARRDQAGNDFADRIAAGVARHPDRRHPCREPRGR